MNTSHHFPFGHRFMTSVGITQLFTRLIFIFSPYSTVLIALHLYLILAIGHHLSYCKKLKLSSFFPSFSLSPQSHPSPVSPVLVGQVGWRGGRRSRGASGGCRLCRQFSWLVLSSRLYCRLLFGWGAIRVRVSTWHLRG